MKFWRYIYGTLILAIFVVWLAFFEFPDKNFHLIACDVGQGDAILAFSGSTQILTDGGPDNRVLECLARHLPFWDRKIELVILTHPQKDHYQGLIEVVRRYKVDNFLSNGLDSSTEPVEVLKKEVGSRGVRVLSPKQGQVIRSGLMRLEILWPVEKLVSDKVTKLQSSNLNPNDFSIVSILSFGEFDALLTGDIGASLLETALPSADIRGLEYLKVPHHGSKNGLSQSLLEKVNPRLAVISVGKNNPYGHPHQEVIKLLSDEGAKLLRTDLEGEVEVVSDGQTWGLKHER